MSEALPFVALSFDDDCRSLLRCLTNSRTYLRSHSPFVCGPKLFWCVCVSMFNTGDWFCGRARLFSLCGFISCEPSVESVKISRFYLNEGFRCCVSFVRWGCSFLLLLHHALRRIRITIASGPSCTWRCLINHLRLTPAWWVFPSCDKIYWSLPYLSSFFCVFIKG